MKAKIVCIAAFVAVLFTGCKAQDEFTPGNSHTPMYCKLTFDESLYDAINDRNTGSNMESYIYSLGSNPIRLVIGDFKQDHNTFYALLGSSNAPKGYQTMCFMGVVNSLEDIPIHNLPVTGWNETYELPATQLDVVKPGEPASRSIREKYGYVIRNVEKGIYIAVCMNTLKITTNSALEPSKGVTVVAEFVSYPFDPVTGWK